MQVLHLVHVIKLKVIVLSSSPSQFVSDDDEVIIIFPEGRGAGVERV